MRVSSAYLGTGVLAGFLATAIAGCGDDQPATSAGDGDLASVTLELGIAPTDARCAVITATPETGPAVVRSITLIPQQPTVFTLTGLPLGTITFTQQVFTVACSMVTATTPPTWITDPVTVTLAAGLPVDLFFALRRVDGGGQVTIHDDFPVSPNQISLVNVGTPSARLATGPDGNVWFTNNQNANIGRVSPSGSLTTFTISTDALADDITAGPDGNMWVIERSLTSGNRITRVTPAGVVTRFPTFDNEGDGRDIASGPDGNLWFTSRTDSRIGRMTTGGSVTFFSTLTANAQPSGITAGPDGNIWFTEAIGRVGRSTPSGVITEFSTPTPTLFLEAITTGADGNVWYVQTTRVGRVTPTGAITEFTVPAGNYTDITAGPDGNIWFVGFDSSAVRRITPAGVVTTFQTGEPAFASFFGIATGPDANLWVSELNGLNLVRLKP